MKKIFTTLFALAALAVQAQYLPNGGFDSWKSACGSTEAFGTGSMSSPKTGEMRQRPGVEPTDWNGSSINQKVVMTKSQQLVFNEGNAVKLQNVYVGAMGIGSVAPGYITLGTPWVYASSTLTDCDGGTYGGVQFTNKPDAIKGRFKRDDSTGENSYIIVYMWNGTFVSNVGPTSNPNQARNDVDRAILGKTTPTSNGTLVAQCQRTFSSTVGDWQEIIVPIEYANNQNPEMMNVVISGGDYFNRGNLKENTTLLVDDVQFVYYSDLSYLRYDGVDCLKSGQTDYVIYKEYDESKLLYAAKGKGATVEQSFDSNNNVLTITVKGNDFAANSNSKTVYTVKFDAEGGVVEPEPTPDPTPGESVDYTPTFTGAKTRGTRWINTVALASETYADEAANAFALNNDEQLCYNDYTATVEMMAAAGETVTLSINDDDATSWMHAFVYIDADKNGFNASIAEGSNWQPAGDLVSYSFYNNDAASDGNGWNSIGSEITGDARSTVALPAFTVPAEAGIYRVRVKLDWCNIDPNGDQDGKFGDFMDNGGQIVDFMLNVVGESVVEPEPEPEPEPTPGEDVDYTPTYTGTRNYSERNINAVKIISEQSGEQRYDLNAEESASEYLDLTEVMTLNAAPGERFSVEFETKGSWINHYVYIDFDADGFTASIEDGNNWQPAEDLVAYSFYNNGGYSDTSGWNSEGEIITGDSRSNPSLPSFVVPAEPGIYRLRIKQDWCSIDPAGDSDSNFGGVFSNYGGQIIDILLHVTDSTGIEDVEEEMNPAFEGIYDLNGRKLNEITKTGIYIVNGKKVFIKK